MAEPIEEDKATAGALCERAGCDCGGTGAIARTVTRAGHGCDGDDSLCVSVCPVPVEEVEHEACELNAHFAAALAAEREQERRVCWGIANLHACVCPCPHTAVEIRVVADAIAARGPMGEP